MKTRASTIILIAIAAYCLVAPTEIFSQSKSQLERWHQLAAQGDVVSQYNLGYCYSNGKGVSKDMGKALKWYNMAVAQGDKDAIE